MIRRGRAQGWLKLPVSAIKPWADVNGIDFNGMKVGPLAGFEERGSTIIAQRAVEGGEDTPLMTIPQEFVLSLEYVEGQAKVDQNLRQLLAAIGDYGRV